MIHAYAIQPEVVKTWVEDRRLFGRIIGEFGRGTPRVFLEIPKFSKWRKAIFKLCEGIDDLARARLEALFKFFADCRVRRENVPYDGEKDWLENAESEYGREPFEAIIALSNPRKKESVLLNDDVGDYQNAKWKKPLAKTPLRNANDLSEAVQGLLKNSQKIYIIDFYFNPSKQRYTKVFDAYVDCLGSSTPIHVFCGSEKNLGLKHFEKESRKLVERYEGKSTLSFGRWKERDHGGERFHNRYILSNLGGVILGGGIDQDLSQDSKQTEDINLMSKEQYERHWDTYVDNPEMKFVLVDEPLKPK